MTVTHPVNGEIWHVQPGQWRVKDVQVGRHVAPPPEEIPALLDRFQQVYTHPDQNKIQRILNIPAAHHRLLWIHPFLDGNGRVARLMSHAMFRELGLGSGLWAISRGLARQSQRYKELLMNADNPRQGDLDGRGNLSLRALEEFSLFFLENALDQVGFMSQLLAPATLANRIRATANLPSGGGQVLWQIFFEGEISRGRVAELAGCQERQARNITRQLLERGLLESSGPRAPLHLGMPLETIPQWFPGLYPKQLFSS